MFSLHLHKYENHTTRHAFYYLGLVTNEVNKKAVLIKVYGKIGASGQGKVEQFAQAVDAQRQLESQSAERLKNKYELADTKMVGPMPWEQMKVDYPEVMDRLMMNHRGFLDVEGTKSVMTANEQEEVDEQLAASAARTVVKPQEYGTW